MPLDRTWYNTLIDDDGTNTVGTIWNKAAVDHVYDDVDAELVRLDTHRYDTVPATLTTTSVVNNWTPGLVGHTFTRWNGVAELYVTGLAGGAAGQRWTFKNTGTRVAYFYHANAGSIAANQFVNAATSAATPVAGGGWITYEYDGATWQLVTHNQGAWASAPFAASNFRTGASPTGWTVTAGNVAGLAYFLNGRLLDVAFSIDLTSVSPASVELQILNTAYGGFTAQAVQYNDPLSYAVDVGTQIQGAMAQVNVSGVLIRLLKFQFTNWGVASGNTTVYGKVKIGVV